MIKNDIKIAYRTMLNNKQLTFFNIGGLAIAIAASVFLLVWVQNELRFDAYHPDNERIHLLVQYDSSKAYYSDQSPYPIYQAVQEDIAEVENIASARLQFRPLPITSANGTFEEKNILTVDGNWFTMFHFDLIEGSFDDFSDETDHVVITQPMAQKLFGDESAISQVITIDEIPYTVAAVVGQAPVYSSFQHDVFIPHSFFAKKGNDMRQQWGFSSQYTFLKLFPLTSKSKVEQKITDIFRNNQPWRKESTQYSRLIPIGDVHFKNEINSALFAHGNYKYIYIYIGLAILLMATASANFVNISIAQTNIRMKEIGVRKVVGATKKQLFVQVMTETLVKTCMALMMGLFIVLMVLPYFNFFTEKQFLWTHFASLEVIGLLVAIFIFVLLLTGIYPALLTTQLKPIGLLKDKKTGKLGYQGLQKILVIGQFVLVVTTLIGTMTIQRQFAFIQRQTAGYQKEQVFHFWASSDPIGAPAGEASLNNLKHDLMASSAVQIASRVNGVSVVDDKDKGPFGMHVKWPGYPQREDEPDVVNLWVDENYDKVANISLIAGRWFDVQYTRDKHNIILNETAVKAYGLKEPVVGTSFSGGFHGEGGFVIGVVKDFHHKNLYEAIDPVVISMDPFMGAKYYVKAQSGNVVAALKHAEKVWKKYYPGSTFAYTFLDEEFEKIYKEDRRALVFGKIFGGLCIVLSCTGLFGMMLISTQQRIKEIGIRKVLGASVSGIVTMLAKDFIKLVCLAIVIASPIAWWAMNKWLEDFVYRIDVEWWMFAVAGGIAVAIALLTVSWQAIRAAVANPVDSLRDE